MGYADQLTAMLDDDIRPAPVLPTGHYLLNIASKGKIVDNDSTNEKAPAAYVRFTVTASKPMDVDPDEIKAAMEKVGYTDEVDFFSNWKNAADFEVWSPREGESEENLLRNISARIRRVLGISDLRADASLAEVLEAASTQSCQVIGFVEAVESDSGVRNYRIGSRGLSPAE